MGGCVVLDIFDYWEKMMKVCVLGGGYGCYVVVIDLFEKGYDVMWWWCDCELYVWLCEFGVLNVVDYCGKCLVLFGDVLGVICLIDDFVVVLCGV